MAQSRKPKIYQSRKIHRSRVRFPERKLNASANHYWRYVALIDQELRRMGRL